jgi:hypothetical protein
VTTRLFYGRLSKLYAMRWRRATVTGIVAPAVRGRRVFPAVPRAACLALSLVLAGLLASGCGAARQDAGEPHGDFRVQVLDARFPARQAIARPTSFLLRVRNPGPDTVPNLAISVDSFSYTSTFPELASRQRPVWIIDQGPGKLPQRPVKTATVDPAGAGQTAFVNTWSLGPLAPGRTRTFLWLVTPVKAGLHQVHFLVSAGLNGKARALLAGGALPTGHFLVNIAPAPPPTHVNPSTGAIEPGPSPTPAGPVPVSP